MTKFQYLERVADWVKTSQLESEGSLLKPHLALSWEFITVVWLSNNQL